MYNGWGENENDNIAIKLLSLYASMIAALNGLNEKEKKKKNSFGAGNQDDNVKRKRKSSSSSSRSSNRPASNATHQRT